MTYVINSPVAHAVLKNSVEMSTNAENVPEQINRLEEENRALQRRVHTRTLENGKLQQRIDKVETELQSYRQMIEQINQSLANGEAPCEYISTTPMLLHLSIFNHIAFSHLLAHFNSIQSYLQILYVAPCLDPVTHPVAHFRSINRSLLHTYFLSISHFYESGLSPFRLFFP